MALEVLWFALWGLLWAVYFVLDGFDFGVAMLRGPLSRDETDRRVALTSIGPVWDGNEVWLVTAGGATFAAFPAVYASMFSFLYLLMMLILFSLIARGVAMELRGKHDGALWRAAWDRVLAVSSFAAPFFLGLAFGNIFRGLPVDGSGYHGGFGMLFNPYALLTGLLFVLLFLQHGALWLASRTGGETAARAVRLAGPLWVLVLAVAAGFLVTTALATRLDDNFAARPGWVIVPGLAVASLAGVRVALALRRPFASFLCSCAAIALVVATGLVGLFPNLIPSSLDPAASLTIYNSSSGPTTLRVMTVVAVVFVPIVVVYQLLVLRFFRHKVTRESLAEAGEGY